MLKNMWKAIFICLLLTLGTFSQKRLSIFCGFRGFGTQSGTGGETAPVPWDVYRAACRRRFAPIGAKVNGVIVATLSYSVIVAINSVSTTPTVA